MSDRVFVGPRVADLDIGEKPAKISRVNILVDSEHSYTAGDDTGRTIEKTVPWGSQAMAEAILAAVKDYEYQPFDGTSALLDPASEIGDGITVGGTYSVLVQKNIAHGKLTITDVSAPISDEIDDEYPYITRSERQTSRQNAYTRSLITKSSEEIKLLVENTKEGLESSITQTTTEIKALIEDTKNGLSAEFNLSLEGITARVDGLDGRCSEIEQTAEGISSRVDGLDGQYSELSQTVEGFTFTGPDGETYVRGANIETGGITAEQIASGTITADKLNIKGAITFEDLAADAQGEITDAQKAAASAASDASDAWTHADRAWDAADRAQETADSANDTVQGWTYGGTTYIDGGMIMTDTIKVSKLYSGYVSLLTYNEDEAGYLEMTGASTASYAVEFGSYGAIRILAGQGGSGDLFLSAGGSTGIDIIRSSGNVEIVDATLRSSSDGGYSLGQSGRKWSTAYLASEPVVSSDEHFKHDIEDLPAKYTAMFDALRPVRFKYDDGTSGRYHTGFIAQDVEAAMGKCGIQDTEFGGFVRGDDGEGGDVLMLRYGEFVGILWAKVQEMDKRIKGLEGAA